MNRDRLYLITAAALVAILAATGCSKEAPVASAPKAAAPKPAATMSVVKVDLGTEVDADMKVTKPMTTFGPMDTIIVAISTSTSDPAATVSGKLGAKWSYQDGTVVNEESREVKLSGTKATNFRIAKPGGWPTGNYKVEISLDALVVQSKDFVIK
jgi:hypothetical protein